MTLGAVLATVAGYSGTTYLGSQEGAGTIPSKLSAMRLDARMQDPQYREEVKKRLEFFLNYYVGSEIGASKMRNELTGLMQSIAPNDEIDAFGVADRENWSFVQYFHDHGVCVTDPMDGFIKTRDNLLMEGEDEDGNTVPVPPEMHSELESYSVLALVHKPTDEEELERFDLLMDLHENILDAVKAMDEKSAYYSWDDLSEKKQEFFADALSPACRALLCDDPWNCIRADDKQ